MNNINKFIGGKIKNYRKMKMMTIQQLADRIHKSRATVSKYENGEITVDIETLYEISLVLEVNLNQITDYKPTKEITPVLEPQEYEGNSPFFVASRLYFYFYDGKHDRLKEAVIDIDKTKLNEDGSYEASLTISFTNVHGKRSEIYYTGNVLYSDMLIRFSFINQYNKLERDLLYIYNPLELRSFTYGLLCGITSSDFMPCAFKCLVTLRPNDDYTDLKQRLMLTPNELRRWQRMNMLIVDNNS